MNCAKTKLTNAMFGSDVKNSSMFTNKSPDTCSAQIYFATQKASISIYIIPLLRPYRNGDHPHSQNTSTKNTSHKTGSITPGFFPSLCFFTTTESICECTQIIEFASGGSGFPMGFITPLITATKDLYVYIGFNETKVV